MRYIGCKTKLLDAIEERIVNHIGPIEGKTLCDMFAGTGSVGDYFQDRCKIIANDNLYFSYVINRAKLLKGKCDFSKLGFNPFKYFNTVNTDNFKTGFCFNNFAPSVSGRQYFSDENAKLIDFIRETISSWYNEKLITLDEHDYLLGCLMESLSKVSNVAGVYAAYLHIWDSRALKKMQFIEVETQKEAKYENSVFNQDCQDLIKEIKGDILYLDPPYTPTQYISQYHVLETIAKNDNPEIHGIGAHRDNGKQISNWSKKQLVAYELEKIIANAEFDYIVMSYSDAGILSQKIIENIFKRYAEPGTVICEKFNFVKYKNTRAVNRETRENTKDNEHYEWLFFMKKAKKAKFASPLNYIGGKYDVLDFILPLFPKKIDTFYDLFGGGSTVCLNAEAKRYVYNDINNFVVELLKTIKETEFGYLFKYLEKTIKKYELSKGKKDSYIKFRDKYNQTPIKERNPFDLYLLICFGFEHQIRFNSSFDFNNPCGNSGFNEAMLEKLISFHLRSNTISLELYNKNYYLLENEIKEGDFVYCDPPYLLTCGAYNDGKRGFNGWDEKQQQQLFEFLVRLNNRNIKFALSYIMERDGVINQTLLEWVEKNNFVIFKNSKITKRNRQDRTEILITNYKE